MPLDKRPRSPHLQIYKPQLTSLLSITHRGTGVFLAIGSLLLALWFLTIAIGPAIYSTLQAQLMTWYGQLALLAWAFSFYYHLANGIRHLFWDAGLGLDIDTTYKSGYAVVIASIVLTAISAILACDWTGGGA
ncbi:MAG: succinate dehydrogenase, cytochrome b556 subunit [Thiotrichales bacterium]|nr:succinate dehydrogenase, cytochrome b556 subunit [Thiotrichales bacterium]